MDQGSGNLRIVTELSQGRNMVWPWIAKHTVMFKPTIMKLYRENISQTFYSKEVS